MGCKGSWLNLVATALGKAQWSLLGWPIGQMGNDPLYVSINHVGVQGSLWYIGVRQRAGTGAGWGTQFASISSLKGWDCCWTSKIRGCYRKLLNSSYFPHQSLWFTLGFGVVFSVWWRKCGWVRLFSLTAVQWHRKLLTLEIWMLC